MKRLFLSVVVVLALAAPTNATALEFGKTKSSIGVQSELRNQLHSKSKPSAKMKKAAKRAKSYLKHSAFSRQGLINQLEYEGFTTEQATYGVDAQKANWNKQAAKSAKSYLKHSVFTHEELVAQLEFEGYLNSEAEYGVRLAGL